jgi:hypothetical protein
MDQEIRHAGVSREYWADLSRQWERRFDLAGLAGLIGSPYAMSGGVKKLLLY